MMKLGVQMVANGAILWNVDSCAAVGPCGHCEELCPTGILSLGGERNGVMTLERATCIRCRLCLVGCPAASLSLSSEHPAPTRLGQEAFDQR